MYLENRKFLVCAIPTKIGFYRAVLSKALRAERKALDKSNQYMPPSNSETDHFYRPSTTSIFLGLALSLMVEPLSGPYSNSSAPIEIIFGLLTLVNMRIRNLRSLSI